jgi:hypothetical protein
MFETESRNPVFSPGLFLAQVFLIPLFSLILDLIFAQGAIEVSGLTILGYIVSALVGVSFGYRAQRADARITPSLGRWIWVPPVCIAV